MKKISTVGGKAEQEFSRAETDHRSGPGGSIELVLRAGRSWGSVLEQKLGTTPKAMKEVFAAMPRSRIALETGMHSPWVSRCVERVGTRSDRGACPQRALDRRESTER